MTNEITSQCRWKRQKGQRLSPRASQCLGGQKPKEKPARETELRKKQNQESVVPRIQAKKWFTEEGRAVSQPGDASQWPLHWQRRGHSGLGSKSRFSEAGEAKA